MATSAGRAKAKEVKDYQVVLNDSKGKLMEEQERVAAFEVADVEK